MGKLPTLGWSRCQCRACNQSGWVPADITVEAMETHPWWRNRKLFTRKLFWKSDRNSNTRLSDQWCNFITQSLSQWQADVRDYSPCLSSQKYYFIFHLFNLTSYTLEREKSAFQWSVKTTGFDRYALNILGLKRKRITQQSMSHFRLCSVQCSVADETPQGSTSLAPFPVKRKIIISLESHTKKMVSYKHTQKQLILPQASHCGCSITVTSFFSWQVKTSAILSSYFLWRFERIRDHWLCGTSVTMQLSTLDCLWSEIFMELKAKTFMV